jgi:hypothetical protein
VSVRARPTDRYQDSSRRASAGIVGSDLARAPTRTLTPTATELVDPTSAPTRSSLPGRRRQARADCPIWLAYMRLEAPPGLSLITTVGRYATVEAAQVATDEVWAARS